MKNTIGNIVNTIFKLDNDKDRNFYKRHLIIFFKELNSSIRTLSEEICNCDDIFVDSIGRLLSYFNDLIIQLLNQEEFTKDKNELEAILAWNIHLPYWFVHYAKKLKSSNPFHTLFEVPAKTGISLFASNGNDKLIKDCIESLFAMVKHALNKLSEGYYFEEPRLMERFVYLGVLALKHKKEDLLIDIGLKIYEFEDLYFKKYISAIELPEGTDSNTVHVLPKRDQLSIEVFHWRDEFLHNKYNRHSLIDDAKDRMYDLIDCIDIDRFMFEVWGSFPADSPIEKEIEEKFKRRAEIRKLIEVLKYRVSYL